MTKDDDSRRPLGPSVRLDDLDLDPYPLLARLRRDEPVSWVPDAGMWFVTRRADVVDMLRNPSDFTTDSEHSTIQDIFGRHMMTTEGDEALRFKRRCLPAFRPATLDASHGSWLSERTRQLFGPLRERGEGELNSDVARPLAIASVLRSLGIDGVHAPHIQGWYDDFAAALANFRKDPVIRARGKSSSAAFAQMVRPILTDLRTTPDDRLLSAMVANRMDPFSDDEAISNALIILFGGIETTESMVSNAVWSLLSHPHAWEELSRNAAMLDNAIEESLRWSPSVQSCTRHAVNDVMLAGVAIPGGAIVQGMLGAANRDPAYFDDPDVFDIRRSNASHHLGFGTGRHLCLGAPLARLETGSVLRALLDDERTVSFHPDRPSRLRGYEFRKPTDLWIVWH